MTTDKKFMLAAILEIFPEKRPHIELINALFLGGLDLLYLRPGSFEQIDWVTILNIIDSAFYKRLIIPASVAKHQQFPCNIYHLKEAERKEGWIEKDSYSLASSTSVHHLSDILQLPDCFRYVFYSPIFPSITKPGYAPKQKITEVNEELARLQEQRPNLPLVIGLGGIEADNIQRVKEAGLDGAALMGALWQSPNPVKAFLEIKNAVTV